MVHDVVAEATSADDIRLHRGYSQSEVTREFFARSNGGCANNLAFNYKTRIGASSLLEQDDADRDWAGPVYLEIPVDVPCGDGFLCTKDRFLISLWREEGYYCADDILGLRISEAAQTYQELLDSICETLAFLWEEYAMAEDSELSEGAIELKQAMIRSFHVQDRTCN